jgi:hypothetical protein
VNVSPITSLITKVADIISLLARRPICYLGIRHYILECFMARLSPEEGLGALEDWAGKAEQETWERFHPATVSKIKHGRTWKQVA